MRKTAFPHWKCSSDTNSPLNITATEMEPRPRAKPVQPVPTPPRAATRVFSDLVDIPASALVRHPPQLPSHTTTEISLLSPTPRLWLQAPVEGDFDGVAWLGFNHPGTAQGILVEARPARRQDGAAGRSQMTAAGSWGDRRERSRLLGGTDKETKKSLYKTCLPASTVFVFMENFINCINGELCLLGPLWICPVLSLGVL